MIRQARPEVVKKRKPRSHMRPYAGIIPPVRLNRERVKIEKEMAQTCCRGQYTLQLSVDKGVTNRARSAVS